MLIARTLGFEAVVPCRVSVWLHCQVRQNNGWNHFEATRRVQQDCSTTALLPLPLSKLPELTLFCTSAWALRRRDPRHRRSPAIAGSGFSYNIRFGLCFDYGLCQGLLSFLIVRNPYLSSNHVAGLAVRYKLRYRHTRLFCLNYLPRYNLYETWRYRKRCHKPECLWRHIRVHVDIPR